MKLELRGITKRFGALTANDHIDLVGRAGRDPLPARRERRRQVDADERALRPVPGRRGRDPARRRRPALRRPRRRDAGRHRHGAPALHARARLHGRGERDARPRVDEGRRPPRPRRRPRDRAGDLRRGSASTSTRTRSSRTCPSACSSGSRSSRRCPATPGCSCSTSRPRCSRPQETDELIGIMRQLRDAGTAIVFITHKLREVREVADRITVIRLGKVVGEAEPTATNVELASLMVGRAVELTVDEGARRRRRRRPRARGRARRSTPTAPRSSTGSSLTVRAGEILAIAGRAGQRADRADRGDLRPAGRGVRAASCSTAAS